LNDIVKSDSLSPLVQAAMSGQLDTDKLSKLLEIQERYEANEARKAFHLALARFKKNDLVLEKDRIVSHATRTGGEKTYRHTSLGAGMGVLNPLLATEDLNMTWKPTQDLDNGGMITVTATMTHAMGHSESCALSASPEDSGGKNNLQAIGSTISYLERYTGFALCGVASMDQDDDGGKMKEPEYITVDQVDGIKIRLKKNDISEERFLKWLAGPPVKCGSIEEIQVQSLDIVNKRIESAVRASSMEARQ